MNLLLISKNYIFYTFDKKINKLWLTIFFGTIIIRFCKQEQTKNRIKPTKK
jgi:hypothetical protein